MPFITIEMVDGRSIEQKRELVDKITQIVSETVDVPPERVFIFIEDLKKDLYAKGGKLLIDQQ